MPHVNGDIPNFVNGISQQTPAMRLPSQSEASTNFYPTVVEGATKRPPTEFLAKINAAYPNAFTHIILRDEVEKYILVIETSGVPHVFDFTGTEMTLTNTSGTYLSAGITDVRKDIRALTIADSTFLVNRQKKVLVGTATSPPRFKGEALFNVMAGNYGKTYAIYVNGTSVASYTTPDGSTASHSAYIDTTYIAAQLVSQMVSNGLNTGSWALGRYSNVIWLSNNSADFTASSDDGYGNRAMKTLKDVVQKFSDLPEHGNSGLVFKITGKDGDVDGDYYVQFEKTHPTNYSGVWRESPKPNTRLGVDPATMPHKLVRNADGTFTLSQITWGGRVAGDIDTNPDPSFVNQTISDVFFHKNRLGILTAENAVLSESGKFYNFYRTTMLTLLDTDVIDIAASHVKVSLLNHAVPFSGNLMIFSDLTQFALKGNELLTPKTAHMDPLTELSAHPTIRPEGAGSSIYFVSEKESWAALNEYFFDKAVDNADSDNVSAHAPEYIPAGVHDLAASSDLNLVVLATRNDPSALYLYRFLWNGKEKIQSAWCRWEFPGAEVLNIAFDKNRIICLMRRDGQLRLESINAEQGVKELVYLDSRTKILTGSYSSITKRTTFTCPFPLPSSFRVVTATGGSYPLGIELTPTPLSSTTFTVPGNYASQPIYLGIPYESRLRLSEQFYRNPQDKSAIQAGRLQLLAMDLSYARSAYFTVEVTPDGREKRTYPFSGRIISDTSNVTGAIVVDSGRFSFPIMSRSDRVKIELVSSSWLPCSFTSAKWKGVFNPHTRQQ